MSFSDAVLKERQGYLNGSEAAASLGMSSWFSALELYQSKMGRGEAIETTIPMMVGTALEPVVLELFERETGQKVINRQNGHVDPKWPVRRCSLDGMVDERTLIEAKTSGDYRGWGDAEDEIPLPYLYNIHHSFHCVPTATAALFPVLIGGRTFRIYRVERDPELMDLVDRGERAFWNHVATNTPPEAQTLDDLKILYPRDNGTEIVATTEIAAAVTALAKAKAAGKLIETSVEELGFQIRKFMGASATLKRATLVGGGGERLATWNAQDEARIDVKRLRAENPQVAEEYTNYGVIRKLLLKVKA